MRHAENKRFWGLRPGGCCHPVVLYQASCSSGRSAYGSGTPSWLRRRAQTAAGPAAGRGRAAAAAEGVAAAAAGRAGRLRLRPCWRAVV